MVHWGASCLEHVAGYSCFRPSTRACVSSCSRSKSSRQATRSAGDEDGTASACAARVPKSLGFLPRPAVAATDPFSFIRYAWLRANSTWVRLATALKPAPTTYAMSPRCAAVRAVSSENRASQPKCSIRRWASQRCRVRDRELFELGEDAGWVVKWHCVMDLGGVDDRYERVRMSGLIGDFEPALPTVGEHGLHPSQIAQKDVYLAAVDVCQHTAVDPGAPFAVASRDHLGTGVGRRFDDGQDQFECWPCDWVVIEADVVIGRPVGRSLSSRSAERYRSDSLVGLEEMSYSRGQSFRVVLLSHLGTFRSNGHPAR